MEGQAKKTVLFLDIHNSTRSQMAEALLKHFRGDKFEPYSAGVEIAEVDPTAIVVLREIGIDINSYQSKLVSTFNNKQFDYVITICSSASEPRPEYANGTKQLSWDFTDPSKKTGTEMEILDEYRKTRDGLTTKIREDLLANI